MASATLASPRVDLDLDLDMVVVKVVDHDHDHDHDHDQVNDHAGRAFWDGN
jgi:hypothetical protein